jgi:hypothetical protein
MRSFFKGILFALLFVQLAVSQWIKDTNYTHTAEKIQFAGNKLLVTDEGSFNTYQLLSGTAEWQTIRAGFQGSFTYGIEFLDSLQWIATEQGFFHSSNSTPAWTLYGDTTRQQAPPYMPSSLAVLPPKVPGEPYRLFSGTLGIGLYASADGGHNWYEIDSARFHNEDILDLQIDRVDADSTAVYMINRAGIFVSTDLGETWVAEDTSAGQGANLSRLWFSGNDWFAIGFNGLLKRNKSTGKWIKCTNFFDNDLIWANASAGSAMFAAVRNKGIYRSDDAGSTWALADSFSAGKADIVGMAANGTDLYVATGAEGLWHIPLISFGITSVAAGGTIVPRQFNLEQNYPNPFNPATNINYGLAKDVHVRLAIYNMLGQEVRLLADGMEQPGYKSVQFDAGNLPSGIYIYRITAGAFTDVKKMVLIR